MNRIARSSSCNRVYWKTVAQARNRWIAGLPEMHGVEAHLAAGRSTLLSGPTQTGETAGEAELLGDVAGCRFLHLGCGSGHDSVSWANLGARVTTVDFAEVNLHECRRLSRLTKQEVMLVSADSVQLPFQAGCFEAVYASGLVAWIGDLAAFYREISRVLASGGRLLLVEEHPREMMSGEDGVPDPKRFPYRDQTLHHQVETSQLPWPMPAGQLETDDYLWTTESLLNGMTEAGFEIERLLEPLWSPGYVASRDEMPQPPGRFLAVVARKLT